MKALLGVVAILLAGVIGLQVYQLTHKPAGGGEDPEKIRAYAVALQENAPDKALIEYERYAKAARLSDEETANLYLTMGNLAMERQKDYATAHSYFVRVKTLYPNSSAAAKVGPKMVVCLENMGQSFDAQRALAASTALTDKDKPIDSGDDVLADVGDSRITRRAFELAMQQLITQSPQQVPQTKQAKIDFLGGLIAKELFYRSALRKGYDKDNAFLAYVDNARKTFLANRIWQEEVVAKVQVTQNAFHAFYQQFPEKFREPAQYTRVGLIICDNEEKARAARARIEKGEDFMAVAADAGVNREEGLRNSRGLLAPFYENQEAITFDRELKVSPLLVDLKVGEMKGPVSIQDGSGIIKLFEKKDARTVPFDEAWESRREDFKNFMELDRKEKFVQELQRADKVKVYDERL